MTPSGNFSAPGDKKKTFLEIELLKKYMIVILGSPLHESEAGVVRGTPTRGVLRNTLCIEN